MASNLDPHLKLSRAKLHLDALDQEVRLFKQSEPHRITTEEDEDGGWYIVKIEHLKDISLGVALIAGDFISCLRSSLDHLAWQLATLTTDSPSRDISFPICEKDSLDTQIRIVKATYGIPDAAVAIMKQFQPYNSGDAYKSTHLWRLNKLWNIDKHRHILLRGVPTDWVFRLDGGGNVTIEQLNNGNMVKIPIASKKNVVLNPQCGVDVEFGSTDEGLVVTLKDFIDMYNFVGNEILPAFIPFLL
jgi:hypothetical protein